MIRLLICVTLFIGVVSSGFSQEFGRNNAYWTYNYYAMAGTGSTQLQFQKDTMIQGKNGGIYQLLYKITNIWGKHEEYIEKNVFTMITHNNIVYITNLYTGDIDTGIDTLYNFDAKAGDSWQLSDVNCKVISTGTANFKGTVLKFQEMEYTKDMGSGPVVVKDTVVENIGNIDNFLDIRDTYWGFWDGNVAGYFECFKNDVFQYGKYSGCNFFTLKNK